MIIAIIMVIFQYHFASFCHRSTNINHLWMVDFPIFSIDGLPSMGDGRLFSLLPAKARGPSELPVPEIRVADIETSTGDVKPRVAALWDGILHPTLWLCQNSYWKWPYIVIIVDFPIKHGDFHSYVNLPEGISSYFWLKIGDGGWFSGYFVNWVYWVLSLKIQRMFLHSVEPRLCSDSQWVIKQGFAAHKRDSNATVIKPTSGQFILGSHWQSCRVPFHTRSSLEKRKALSVLCTSDVDCFRFSSGGSKVQSSWTWMNNNEHIPSGSFRYITTTDVLL